MAKAGRPTKYTPEMLDKLKQGGEQGMGMAELAKHIGISRQTLNVWEKDGPKDFSDALSEARSLSQAWWERKGRLATFGEGGIERFSATAYIFQMKNRFPDDWRDVQRTEHTGADGGAVKVENEGAAKLADFLSTIAERSGTTGSPAGE